MSDAFHEFASRVEAFEIDPGPRFLSFAARLARENRWTLAYAQRVIKEYKRFCILAMRSGHPVTPSEAVDQAWHLHLTYTRSYWERFCGEALGGLLHHEPTQGGVNEGVKFNDWYERTLESYERLFGEEPPPDIWPPSSKRFAHAGEWQWVNAGHHWFIPRSIFWPVTAAVFLLGFLVALPGCSLGWNEGSLLTGSTQIVGSIPFPFNLGGSSFLLFYGITCCVALATALGIRFVTAEHDQLDNFELTQEEVAVLAGGPGRLMHLTIAKLFMEGRITAEMRGLGRLGRMVAVPEMAPRNPGLEHDVYEEISRSRASAQISHQVKPHYLRIHEKLVAMELRHERESYSGKIWWMMWVVVGLGVIRLLQGLWLEEEVGWLVALIVVFSVVLFFINKRTVMVTSAGREYLERYKQMSKRDIAPMDSAPADVGGLQDSSEQLVLANVALTGIGAMSEFPGYLMLARVLKDIEGSGRGSEKTTTSAGCGFWFGGSGGCSGGGGGGGCGGCGGD